MKKIVLITGASKGIGKALAQKMLSKSYFVIGTSRSQNFDFKHKNFSPLVLDLSNSRSITNAHQDIFTKFDKINILINNAGIGPGFRYPKPQTGFFKCYV